MQVILVGFVKVPGIYTLPGNSSVLSALRLAGGISDQGSFRNIEIKRLGEVIGNFDLYDLLINGNNQFNQALRPGDSVVVRAAVKEFLFMEVFQSQQSMRFLMKILMKL